MATKKEVEEFLISDSWEAGDGEGVFTSEVRFNETYTEFVMIAMFDDRWMQIIMPLQKLTKDKLDMALEAIGSIYPVGGLVKIGGHYAYRNSVSVKHFTPDLFKITLAATGKCLFGLKEKLGIA